MTTYVVHENTVEIFGQFAMGMLDGEVAKDDPMLPPWVKTAESGIYDADGNPIEE